MNARKAKKIRRAVRDAIDDHNQPINFKAACRYAKKVYTAIPNPHKGSANIPLIAAYGGKVALARRGWFS